MPKCVKCGEEAEYYIPKDLCENHWLDWWVDDYAEENRMEVKLDARDVLRAVNNCKMKDKNNANI